MAYYWNHKDGACVLINGDTGDIAIQVNADGTVLINNLTATTFTDNTEV